MTDIVQSLLSSEQIDIWLRGLLSLAWADGDFDAEEQKLIASLTHDEFAATADVAALKPVTPAEVAAVLGQDSALAENFMRTAVMVVLADGIYSPSEDELLQQFCQALGVNVDALESLRHTLEDCKPDVSRVEGMVSETGPPGLGKDVLSPVKKWLDGWEVHDPKLAHFVCKMVPSQCPFERDITLFGRKVVHIPPMCKLNPLYEQLVGLRFRALSYLADECKEDISEYC